MSSGLTVLCHYYNESYMLRWWLEHHCRLFDHGVMIDYGSTDHSNDLIRELAPKWEIRKSRNKDFDLVGCDQEVMEIERECQGWKMVLNTTEFLCVHDKASFVKQLNVKGLSMYRTTGITMLDPLDNVYPPEPDANLPLVKQRHHGIIQMETFHRDRFIHKYSDGAYEIGRHRSAHADSHDIYLQKAYTLHFQFSPWNEEMIRRKLFIQTRIPQKYRDNGLGWQHYVDRRRLEEMYRERAMNTKDLRRDVSCAWIFC
ncbi:glycosyltransferase family 2 protein [Paenibacillus lignilyticus]|uniref:Glycosyltransferase family 2 protein n=1 Tax=Paenibacillus lignilyticus TaxID=1172615 RepID=A0ABS5CJM9_9BACL|nr:glycosyltransferase family 2 protein [Paenibacillus lignilyticus]MBP3966090.1 glycosyltransferase family 2 protein [Paenibacillus lignilyticus]